MSSLTKDFTASVTGAIGYNLRLRSDELGNVSVDLRDLNLTSAEMDALYDAEEVKGQYIDAPSQNNNPDVANIPGTANQEYQVVSLEVVTP